MYIVGLLYFAHPLTQKNSHQHFAYSYKGWKSVEFCFNFRSPRHLWNTLVSGFKTEQRIRKLNKQ